MTCTVSTRLPVQQPHGEHEEEAPPGTNNLHGEHDEVPSSATDMHDEHKAPNADKEDKEEDSYETANNMHGEVTLIPAVWGDCNQVYGIHCYSKL